ncbi:MAG: EscU/YscU/HrcU family type III secretion system export apparatus switch protein [Alphaproteobacteria bacterium]
MTDADDARRLAQLAVALKHDPTRDEAPRITATGRGAVAEQILAIAFAQGVKVREDADLASILATVELDSPVPTAVFATVAEILSYVYRVNGRAAGAGDGNAMFGEVPR